MVLEACGASTSRPSSSGSTSRQSPAGSSASSSSNTGTSIPSATLSGSFAAPSRTGAGVAPSSAAGLVTTSASSVTLVGDGGDMQSASDNLVFAGAACQSASTTLVARLTSFSNLNCPYLYPWARVGLIARGDLSSLAPMVAIALTAANGLEVLYRTGADASTFGHYGTGTNTFTTAQATTVNGLPATNVTGTGNVLDRPIWLKLQRNGSLWTPSYSLDGVSYTTIPGGPAGTGVTVSMNGCWVGLFANAVNVVFANKKELGGAVKGQIQAVFQQPNFPTTTEAQVGAAQGLAPSPNSSSAS